MVCYGDTQDPVSDRAESRVGRTGEGNYDMTNQILRCPLPLSRRTTGEDDVERPDLWSLPHTGGSDPDLPRLGPAAH